METGMMAMEDGAAIHKDAAMMQHIFDKLGSQDPENDDGSLPPAWTEAIGPSVALEQAVRNEALEAAMTDVAAIVKEASSKREKPLRGSFRGLFAARCTSANRPPETTAAVGGQPSPHNLPTVFVVINATTIEKVLESVEMCTKEGCAGVFLVNTYFDYPQLLPIIRGVRWQYPNIFLGVNFKTMSGADAFPILGKLAREGVKVDAYWADNAGVDNEENVSQTLRMKNSSGWDGLHLGGVACSNPKSHPKLCKPVAPEDLQQVAGLSARYCDVVVTSGNDADEPPDIAKIATIRAGCGNVAVGVCSGLTPENVGIYTKDVDCLLVSTSVQADAETVDQMKLKRFIAAVQACNV